jgi:hypothetical protein
MHEQSHDDSFCKLQTARGSSALDRRQSHDIEASVRVKGGSVDFVHDY